jgi:hypothetical protein
MQLAASASSTHTCAIASHPRRPLYLSGSSGDHIFLWQYGEPASQQAYVPLLDPTVSSGSGGMQHVHPGGIRSSAGGGEGDMSNAALALSAAAPGRKQLLMQLLQSPHWDGAVRLVLFCFVCLFAPSPLHLV